MNVHIPIDHLEPYVAIAAGVLVLVMPSRINFILAAYLILVGILGLGLFR